MILHLQAAGVPISWTVVALYGSSYGIAYHAAKSWQEREEADHLISPYSSPHTITSPHFLVEMSEKDGVWQVKQKDLLMSERYLKRQEHDERRSYLVQFGASPLPLGEPLEKAVTDALHAALVDFGYLIPRAEWKRLYPGQVLIQEHYNAFSRAYDEHRRSGKPGRMPFELRWAPYMEAPQGFVFPFNVTEDGDGWSVTKDGVAMQDMRFGTNDDASAAMRLLNSGYAPKEIPVLLDDKPVG